MYLHDIFSLGACCRRAGLLSGYPSIIYRGGLLPVENKP
jgi:hypothetical protein